MSCRTEEARHEVETWIRMLQERKNWSDDYGRYILRVDRWKRKYFDQYLEDLKQDRSPDLYHFDLLKTEISQVVDALNTAYQDRCALKQRAIVALPHLQSVMVDIAVAFGAAGGYDGLKHLVKSKLNARTRAYSESELTEHAQRALAIRRSLQFRQLKLDGIETVGISEAVARFTAESGERYRVSIKMIGGIAVITRLQRQLRGQPSSDSQELLNRISEAIVLGNVTTIRDRLLPFNGQSGSNNNSTRHRK
jgi:hypothetical protein